MLRCTACSNHSSYKDNTISYFVYPSDSDRRLSWLKAVGREDLTDLLNSKIRRRVCEEHFEQKYIRVSSSLRKYLTPNAIPTLRLRSKEGSGSSSVNNVGTGSLTQSVTNNIVLSGWWMNPKNSIEKLIVLDYDADNNSVSETNAINVCKNENQASNSKRRKVIQLVPTQARLINTNTKQKQESKYECTGKIPNGMSHVQLVPTQARPMDTNTEQNQVSKYECIGKIPKGMSQLMKWQRKSKEDNSEKCDRKSFLCFALHLHYLGSTTYNFLRNTFCLPPLNTLRKFVKPRGTKVDDTLFSVLKIKLDKMGPQEKICSVCVSCVPIKTNLFYDVTHDRIIGFNDISGTQKYKPAYYAVMIMIRGIVLNWKQLIGYAFLSQFQNDADVKTWINEIISYLLKIGFDVRALVSDHTDFLNFSNSVNIDQTYLLIRGQKIYYIFDVPRLINCVKNNLMIYDYFFEGKVAKWCHIKYMYDQDKSSIVRLAPKLTQNHFEPTNCVKLTAQVFSTTVAFAIKTLMQSNLIDLSARDTIELILKLDKLFDILNSSKLRSPNKFKTAFCGDDFQIDFLQEMLRFFRSLELVEVGSVSKYNNKDATYNAKFVKCFQITIKSFLHLFKDIQLQGIKFIYTKRLNLEPIDRFFEKVNQSNGVTSKPTCRQVSQTYNQIFVSDILKEPVKKAYGTDFESLLTLQEENSSLIEEFSRNSEDIAPIFLDSNDYQFELPKENGLLTMSVYLYKKCLEKHTCETIQQYINICKQELAECTKDYTPESYTALPDHFHTFIKMLDETFCDYFNKMCSSNNCEDENSPNIGNEVLSQIQKFTFEAPCECFPIEYLKRLFVRSRIYHSVKKYNAFLKTDNYDETMPFEISFL